MLQGSISACNPVCVSGSEWAVLYVYCVSSVLCALCSEVLHSSMSTEWPSVSLALIQICFPFILFNKVHDTQYFIKK